MSTKLHIADGLSLPIETTTQAIGIVAKRRVGKSYTARRIAEQLFKAGQQIVIVDPKGDWWGIRSAADGKSPGLPVVILGGERGDLPLDVSNGEVVAQLVTQERVSVLLDLSLFRKREVATFMTAFLENLYRLKAREALRTPLMLIVDEADAIMPQQPQEEERRMLGAGEDIVRRGGQRGIGCMMITQRTAVLNKNVLTQCEMLIALRTISPQDLKAMQAWIDVHGTIKERDELMASLPSLPNGDAWFWSPGWPTADGIFKRVHVLPIETFDSGATPKAGEQRIEPKRAADVDLEALRRQMSATIERAKADDPKELRKRIAALENELKRKPAAAAPDAGAIDAAVKRAIDRRARSVAQRDQRIAAALTKLGERLIPVSRIIADILKELSLPLAGFADKMEPSPNGHRGDTGTVAGRSESTRPLPPRRVSTTSPSVDPDGDLPKGERAILTAAAQYPDAGVTREQLTVLTGYKRSSRDTYVQRLQARGLVSVLANGAIAATDDGVATLGDEFEPLPTGVDLRVYWLNRLPLGEQTILKELLDAYPDSIDRGELSARTSYKRSSRDTYLQRLGSRKLVTSDASGVRASDTLFDEAGAL